MSEPVLRVESLKKYFPVTRGLFGKTVENVRAVDDISFEIAPGETLGLVGESGCGKSTVGRTLLHLYRPTAGQVWFDGQNLANLSSRELLQVRRNMQIVFQDPFSSLNPRMRVFDIVGEALQVHGIARGPELRERVLALLEKVGVSARWADRYAHEFSGGQRQRIGIARAIAMNPKLVVCDEAVSALDVSIQAQIINLLIRLRQELGLSYLFISHDLSVVRHISHRVMVMYLGHIVELAATRDLFKQPAHPYTRALLSAVPVPDPRHHVQRIVLHGDVPTPLNPPSGCRFHTRCPVVFERCAREEPALYRVGKGPRTVKCFHGEGLTDDEEWYTQLLARFEQVELANSALNGGGPPRAERPRLGERPSASTQDSEVRGAAEAAPSPAAQRSRVARPWWHWPLIAGLAGVVLWLLVNATVDARRVKQAQGELAGLRSELTGFARTTGRLPKRLSELGFRLGFVFGTRAPLDPWGRPYQYVVAPEALEAPEAPTYQLWSLGPDGQVSEDDVR